MDTRILAGMAGQHGLLSRRDLEARGFSSPEVRRLARAGDLVSVRRGWWTTGQHWQTLDDHRGRPRLRALAAGLALQHPFVFSHDSAALLWGLPTLRPRREFVHVTRDPVLGGRGEHGVKHHTAPYSPEQVVQVAGFDCLDIPRTVADLGRQHGFLTGVVAADAARHRGVALGALWSAVEPMVHWRGVRAVRRAILESTRGAESVGETLARMLVRELGLPEDPETQFPVVTPRGVLWCDLRVGNHVFEFNGLVKLLPPELGGVATRQVAEVVVAAAERQSLLRSERLGVSNLIWSDVWGQGRDAARTRLAREYAATERTYGRTLQPHLAEQAMRLRGRRWAS